jgi:hypothetical protein
MLNGRSNHIKKPQNKIQVTNDLEDTLWVAEESSLSNTFSY